MPDNRPSIVDDVTAIRRGLERLERERRLAQFQLPATVSILFQFDPTDLQAPVNISYMMRNNTLIMHKVRGRGAMTRQTIDEFTAFLYRHWPSCRSVNDYEIELAPEDAAMLRTLVQARASGV